MDSPCIKQTVCKVLKIFQYGKYLVAYVLNAQYLKHRRTSDSLNIELPIELVSNKITFYHEKDSRFNH